MQTRTADANATLSHVRLEDGQGNVIHPLDNNVSATTVSWEVLSDTQAVIPLDTFDYRSDGPWRRVRAARGNGAETLSSTNNVDLINWITTKPTITTRGR